MEKLIISNLSKTYANGIQALQNVSLNISKGVFGLLGPNGAGKSTLMRTVATLQAPDTGSIKFGNINVLEQKMTLRKVLGYLPQDFGLYPKVSAEKLLNHLALLKGIINQYERKESIAALLHKVNLYDVRKQKLGSYSGGMKQRFGIAQALLNQPKLLIVDEPTAGLDPIERNRFFDLLSEIGEQIIVIYSTHIVNDIKALCSELAIINQGKVITQGSPIDMINGLQDRLFKKTIPKNELEDYQERYQVINVRKFMGKTIIQVFSEQSPGDSFETINPNLEDIYLFQIFNFNAQ